MRTKLAIIGAAVCLARAAVAVTMASQPWTTNRIAEAEARVASNIGEKIAAAARESTNYVDWAFANTDFGGIVLDTLDQIDEEMPRYTKPIDILAAMTAATNHTDAAASAATNYTDHVAGEFMYGFRSVDKANSATHADIAQKIFYDGGGYTAPDLFRESTNIARAVAGSIAVASTNYTDAAFEAIPNWAKAGTKPSYSWGEITGKPQVVDETGAAAIAETVVREKSLGGIWDTQLEVWWTPHMANGALRYETNAVQNTADTLAVVSNIVASGGLASVDAVDAKISTNNPAFVAAVTNCPVVIASTNKVGGVKVDGTSVTITDGAISSHVDPLNKMWEFRLSDGGGATAKAVGRIIGVSDNTAIIYCQLKDTSDIEWSSYISYYLFSMIIDFNSDAYTAISGVTDGSTFAGVIATLYFADAYTIMLGDKPSTTQIEYSTVVFKDVATSN